MKVAAPIAPYLPQTDLRSLKDEKKLFEIMIENLPECLTREFS